MTAAFKPPSSQEGFFWKTKTLEEMSSVEWESLCDGCARCCLEKLEDEDTGKIYFTHVSCKLLDAGLCACKDYKNRSDKVPDCVRLTPENVRTLNWLPPSCGYKLVAEGRDLYWWHPLISGDPNTEPGFPCAGGCREPRTRSRTPISRTISCNGRRCCPSAPGSRSGPNPEPSPLIDQESRWYPRAGRTHARNPLPQLRFAV
jgi:uncharacterized cysteine cluster protein YcgN (CxxCxxCC family)